MGPTHLLLLFSGAKTSLRLTTDHTEITGRSLFYVWVKVLLLSFEDYVLERRAFLKQLSFLFAPFVYVVLFYIVEQLSFLQFTSHFHFQIRNGIAFHVSESIQFSFDTD